MCQPLGLHCTTCPWSVGYWENTIQHKNTVLVRGNMYQQLDFAGEKSDLSAGLPGGEEPGVIE